MTKNEKPLISVIVSTQNEQKNINKLFKSILHQNYPNYEIIVVDNFSTDDTVKLAKNYAAKVFLKGPERSAQRNYGAKKALGKYLLFLDADMELTPNAIKNCVDKIIKTGAVAVIIPEDVKMINFFSQIKKLEKRLYWHESNIEAARFYDKHVFEKIGGYNEKLVAGEDWDLSQKAQKSGKIETINECLFHNESSFFSEFRKKIYYAKYIARYARLYPDQFKKQSGFDRIELLLRKRDILFKNPISTLGLLLVKGIEYVVYRIVLIYLKLTRN